MPRMPLCSPTCRGLAAAVANVAVPPPASVAIGVWPAAAVMLRSLKEQVEAVKGRRERAGERRGNGSEQRLQGRLSTRLQVVLHQL